MQLLDMSIKEIEKYLESKEVPFTPGRGLILKWKKARDVSYLDLHMKYRTNHRLFAQEHSYRSLKSWLSIQAWYQ